MTLGTIERRQYWLAFVQVFLASCFGVGGARNEWSLLAAEVLWAVIGGCLFAMRLHALGRFGYWALAPIAGYVAGATYTDLMIFNVVPSRHSLDLAGPLAAGVVVYCAFMIGLGVLRAPISEPPDELDDNDEPDEPEDAGA